MTEEHSADYDAAVEALETCREQRADLLDLIEVEREQHAEALVRAWHEGYGAGSSDATDGWLSPGCYPGLLSCARLRGIVLGRGPG